MRHDLKAALRLCIIAGGMAVPTQASAQTYDIWTNSTTGYCLGVAAGNVTNGTPIIVWQCNENTDQSWTNIGDQLPYPPGTYYSYRDGTNVNKCLGVKGGSGANGAALVIWDCLGTSHPDQYWELQPVGNGCYVWYNASSGKVMGVQGGSLSEGAAVIQWDYLGHPDQQWCPTQTNVQ